MPYALRDKDTGQVVVLSFANPLCFLTKDEIESGTYLPDHVERIEVEVHVTNERNK